VVIVAPECYSRREKATVVEPNLLVGLVTPIWNTNLKVSQASEIRSSVIEMTIAPLALTAQAGVTLTKVTAAVSASSGVGPF